MDAKKEKELFEDSPVRAAIFRLAFPAVISQIILVVYNMADTFFVGLVGSDATLTAVTVCMPALMFLSAISNLFGVGGASVISRALGSGDSERVGRASSFALYGCLATTLFYSGLAFLLRDSFADALGGVNPAVHKSAVAYLVCTVAIGGAAASCGMLFSHLIRSEGRSLQAGIGISLGGVLNIVLDPFFIFVVMPKGMEALGAAIATALSNLVSLLYFIAVLRRIRKETLLRFRYSKRIFDSHVPRAVISAGLPACIMTLFENISYAVLDKLMSAHGLAMQAGIGVAKKINMLAHCVVRGIAQGSLPLIGYNFSSGNRERMRDSVRLARRAAIVISTACMAINLIFARPLISVFIHQDSPSLALGAAFLRILCIGGPFSAGAYIYISFFQATGEGSKSFLLAIMRKGIVDIPLMFLLGAFWPVYGIVTATPVADAICCLIANVLFAAYIKRLSSERHGVEAMHDL
ncbi:MAG: hypothetical protein IJU01_07200 [Lachnospiraceae bacterium]|nr:hypothetical protein [Lachnospiraceae bacterium]